jgi:hypothetical protein
MADGEVQDILRMIDEPGSYDQNSAKENFRRLTILSGLTACYDNVNLPSSVPTEADSDSYEE